MKQLSAYGASDVDLSCNPTARPPDFRRMTKRSVDTVKVPLVIGPDGTARITVPHGGDLLRNVVVEVPEPGGNTALESASVLMDGTEIDAVTHGCLCAMDEVLGDGSTTRTRFTVLRFWFSGTDKLPMIRVSRTTIELKLCFSRRVTGANVIFEFTYLENQERRMLINSRLFLEYNMEVSHVVTGVWVIAGRRSVLKLHDHWSNSNVKFLVVDARLPGGKPADLTRICFRVDNTDIDHPGEWWNEVQPRLVGCRALPRGMYLIPFCTEPRTMTHYTGSFNMGRVDSVEMFLYTDHPLVLVNVYARSYNVFRIPRGDGFCGLAREPPWPIQQASPPSPSMTPSIVRIQAAWRGYAERKRHELRLDRWYRPGGPGAVKALKRLNES